MKPNRKPAAPDPMEAMATRLSALFAGANWTPSVENFKERPFVVRHGSAEGGWFTVAGAPAGKSMRAKSCRTEKEVLDFLAQGNAEEAPRPQPEPEKPAAAETAPQPPPEPVIQYRDTPETVAERDDLKRRLEEAEAKLAQPPPSQDIPDGGDRPQQLPPDPESAKLSEFGEVGSSVPPEIRDLMEEGETIAQAKTRITQLLWVEQAELRQLQGKKGENLKREGEIEFLLGLLARLSD